MNKKQRRKRILRIGLMEIWITVKGYKSYQVSNMGRVRSKDRFRRNGRSGERFIPGQIIQPVWSDKKNPHESRLIVTLYDHETGKKKNELIHRLVLLHFRGPCPPGMEGCHTNGNPADNRHKNLRWATPEDNWKDRRRHTLHRFLNDLKLEYRQDKVA